MKLWHYELLPYLSDKAITTQWGELNTIMSKKKIDNLSINYIYKYDAKELLYYVGLVMLEMKKRNIPVYSYSTLITYYAYNYEGDFEQYGDVDDIINDVMIDAKYCLEKNRKIFKDHHTPSYLLQCFFNLQEKSDRGAPDLNDDIMEKMTIFVTSKLENMSLYDAIMFLR